MKYFDNHDSTSNIESAVNLALAAAATAGASTSAAAIGIIVSAAIIGRDARIPTTITSIASCPTAGLDYEVMGSGHLGERPGLTVTASPQLCMVHYVVAGTTEVVSGTQLKLGELAKPEFFNIYTFRMQMQLQTGNRENNGKISERGQEKDEISPGITRKGPGAGTAEGRAKRKRLQMAEDLVSGVNIAREERCMEGEEGRGSTHCDEDVSISDIIGINIAYRNRTPSPVGTERDGKARKGPTIIQTGMKGTNSTCCMIERKRKSRMQSDFYLYGTTSSAPAAQADNNCVREIRTAHTHTHARGTRAPMEAGHPWKQEARIRWKQDPWKDTKVKK
ncbi:hypothetical protein K438DRAFT_1756095 [Mycena galopus ATCC 62051]|nr:hypothetical protein K438DRAFT_1756095 [Mycena galopus ATCC 62051]